MKKKGFNKGNARKFWRNDCCKKAMEEQVKEICKWKSFSYFYKLEKSFLRWAKKNKAKICPHNVIRWYDNKFKAELKKYMRKRK